MQTTAVRSTPYYPWVVNSWIDLLFICGGMVWICTFAHLAVERIWNVPLFAIVPSAQLVSMYLFSNAHTVSTWVRIGHSPENRREFRIYIILGVAAVALAMKGMTDADLAAILVKIYVLWVAQHYTAQAYGLALVYLYKTGYPVTLSFKRTLRAAFLLIAVASILRNLTFAGMNLDFFILPLPFWGPLPEWIFNLSIVSLCVCLGLVAGHLAWNYYSRGVLPPLGVILLLGSTLVFLLQNGYLLSVLWLYVPPFFHGSQYVILSGTFHMRQTGIADRFTRAKAWKAWFTWKGLIYCAVVVAGGALLYELSPRVLAHFGVEFAAALGAIFATANFHHFLTDRAIWRLRDRRVRDLTLT